MKHLTISAMSMLLLAALAVGQEPGQPIPDPLPGFLKISRIESITADLHDDASKSNITFIVPKSNWKAVLESLQPAKRDHKQASGKVLGSLAIRYSDSPSKLAIELFEVPEGPGGFAIQENGGHMFYYRGGDSEKLKAALLKDRAGEK